MLENFVEIDGKYFNSNHITYITCKEVNTTASSGYKILVVSSPESYVGNTLFPNERKCRQAINRVLSNDATKKTETEKSYDLLESFIKKEAKDEPPKDYSEDTYEDWDLEDIDD